MPLYDYQCEACGEKSEKNVKISERDNPQLCKFLNCEGEMKRVVSAPAVHYDGLKSGDY